MISRNSELKSSQITSNRRSFLRILGTGFGAISLAGIAGCVRVSESTLPLVIQNQASIRTQGFSDDELIRLIRDSKIRWRRALRAFLELREDENPSTGDLETLREKIRDARETAIADLIALQGSRFENVINNNLNNRVPTSSAISKARALLDNLQGDLRLPEEENFVNQLWSFLDSRPRRVHAVEDIFRESDSIVSHLRAQLKEIKAQTLINGLKGTSSSITGNCQNLENTSFLLIAGSTQICEATSSSSDCEVSNYLAAIAVAAALIGCDFGGEF